MALTRTSLAADMSASDLTAAVTSTAAGFPAVGSYASPQQMMQVDDEYMLIQVVPVAGVVKVMQRGYNGSAAVAHDILAPVVTSSLPGDWVNVPVGEVVNRPPDFDQVVSVGENGVIPVPIQPTVYVLTKATALGTTTFGAPGKDQDGLRVTFTSQTAAAHVITATTLWGDGVSGSPHTTATWAAFIGASLTVVAENGLWNVVSSVGVTIT
jgi:hypothetical protein